MVALAVALYRKSHLIVKRSPEPKGGKLRLRILVKATISVAVVMVAELVVTMVVATVDVVGVAGMKTILLQSLLGMFEIALLASKY